MRGKGPTRGIRKQHSPSWRLGMQENASAVKICRAPSSSVFLCEEPTTGRERGRPLATRKAHPSNILRITTSAGGFGRRRGKNRSPNSLPVSVVVGYFPTPKARDRASVAPSLLASLTAVIDKLGDFCARNSSSITNCSYLDNVKFGQ